MNEIYKTIEGYNGRYSVSNKGNIRDNKKGTLKHTYTRKSGYVVVWLSNKHYYVHRLVLLTFDPPKNPSLTVDHIDSRKDRNVLENLQWLTKSENTIKAAREGRHLKGSQQPSAKLTESDVLHIRNECKNNQCDLVGLARQYHVAYPTMWKVVRNLTWRHV